MTNTPRSPKNGDVPLGRVLDFMRVLWSIDHELQSLSKRMDARIGVTGPQRLVLRIVGRFPGISAGRVAEILKVHPSTLTGVFRRLEERALITRKEDAADRRRALLELTGSGAAVDAQRSGTVEAELRRALNKLPADKVAIAEEVLRSLVAELGQQR